MQLYNFENVLKIVTSQFFIYVEFQENKNKRIKLNFTLIKKVLLKVSSSLMFKQLS